MLRILGSNSAEPVQVELVGGDWFEPLLVPAAIILAGLLAAFLSYLVHRQSMASADGQLVARFEHERRLREREAVRNSLDATAETIRGIVHAIGEYSGRIISAQALRRDLERTGNQEEAEELQYEINDMQSEINALIVPAHDAMFEAQPALFRLRMRFPNDHPVAAGFSQWHESTSVARTANGCRRSTCDCRRVEGSPRDSREIRR